MKGFLIVFLTLFFSGSYAMLPRDAEFRQKDVFEYRQNKLAEYEQEQRKHEAGMVAGDRQVRQMLAAPPWNTGADPASVEKTGLAGSERNRGAGLSRQAKKWIFSIISLLFIGGCVWWVKISTEDSHEAKS